MKNRIRLFKQNIWIPNYLRYILAVVFSLIAFTTSFAQEDMAASSRNEGGKKATSGFIQVNSVADVVRTSTPNAGPFHVEAAIALWSSDYFRARYGGVPARLDYLSYRALLNFTFELLEEESGKEVLKALSVSFGNANFVTNTPLPKEDIWYTSDAYVGLAAAFKGGIRAGLTYTAYINPFSPPGIPQDLAFTVVYAPDNQLGSLQPELKLVKAVGQGTGYLIQTGVTPVFKLINSVPLTIAVPTVVGLGLKGYHGAKADGCYGELGIIGTIPLNLNLTGRWTLSAGTFLTLRSETIVGVTEQYDQAENFVPTGFITLAFVY